MAKHGWLTPYYPYSGYNIVNGSIEFTKTNLGTNQYQATANAIETSYGNKMQSGGSVKKYKLASTNHADAFKQIQSQIENGKLFHKNKVYLVSISDLDKKNKLYRFYKK